MLLVAYLSRKVSITEEMKTISKRLKELDVCDKVTLNSKLWEIAYLDVNFLCVLFQKSTKQKVLRRNRWPNNKDQQSVIRLTGSMLMHYILCKIVIIQKRSASSSEQAKPKRTVPMLDQFHPCIHDFIENIFDVKAELWISCNCYVIRYGWRFMVVGVQPFA